MIEITKRNDHEEKVMDEIWVKISTVFDHIVEMIVSRKETEPVDPQMIVTVPTIGSPAAPSSDDHGRLADNNAGTRFIMTRSSLAGRQSLKDRTWLDYYERHPKRAGFPIRQVIVRGDYGDLAIILRDKNKYPKLNALINKIQMEVVANHHN